MTNQRPTLTEIMTAANRAARFDLACGYPDFSTPDWLLEAVEASDNRSRLLLAQGGLPHADISEADNVFLIRAVCDFLGIRGPQRGRVLFTSSGSLAMDRAIAAFDPKLKPLTFEPEMDVIPLLLLDHYSSSALEAVDISKEISLPLDRLLRENKSKCLLAFSSPNNPTGHSASLSDLKSISDWQIATQSAVILDQCFLKIHSTAITPLNAWEHLHPKSDWIVHWDTGKTFGLGHEKIAFLICSESAYPKAIKSLRTVQFDLTSRIKNLFGNILNNANSKVYSKDVWRKIDQNRKSLSSALSDYFTISESIATSFAQMFPKFADNMLAVSQEILDEVSVGLVPGSAFCHLGIANSQFLRCALAREPKAFDDAMRAIKSHFENRG